MKDKKENKAPNIAKLPDTEDLEFNTCSMYDCTGLIPAGITSESEADAYEELYPYVTPVSPPKKEDK